MTESEAETLSLTEHWIEAAEMPHGRHTSFPADYISRIAEGEYGGTSVTTYKGEEFEIDTSYPQFKHILQTMRQVQIFMPPGSNGQNEDDEIIG